MLSVQALSYAYGKVPVLHEISLDVAEGEIICLLGASGCGKTTLLRAIAGLESGYEGTIRYDGQAIDAVPVHERDFGLMFQDFALFPHMNVYDNIAYGLKRRKVSSRDIAKRINEILALVGLAGYDKRDISQLSGGEKQRVALARSLAPNPRLLMLDEPLGSLDESLRARLMVELRDIIKSVGVTAIYVTHDQHEAYAIADRIAVMNAGRIEQIAAPLELYFHPQTIFVARFLGLHNVFLIVKQANGKIVTAIGQFPIELSQFQGASALLLHPYGISLDAPTANDYVNFEGKVVSAVFVGGRFQLQVAIYDVIVQFETRQKNTSLGEQVTIYIQKEYILPLVNFA